MLGKKIQVPLEILQLEALLRRISKNHSSRSRIESDLAARKSGYHGEKSLDYYLSFLKENQYAVFHNLRLQLGSYYFEIDLLLLSLMFGIVIENKNNSGTLVYNPVTKTYSIFNKDNEEEAFSDPIEQAQRQKFRLIKWLTQHQLPLVPLDHLANFSNPSILLKSTGPTDIFRKLGKSDQLLPKILEIEKKFTQEKISMKDLKKISRTLIKHHCPRSTPVLGTYSIRQDETIPGVQCPVCFNIPMFRKHSIWQCSLCGAESKDAHIKGIYDYFLIFEPQITVSKCCWFLQMDNRYSANRLLNSMGLPFTGDNKGRIYLPKEDFFID